MRPLIRGLLCATIAATVTSFGSPAVAGTPDTCVYDPATQTVSVTFPDQPASRAIAREPGGDHILYDGSPCGDATVRNTDLIMVAAGAGAQVLTVDQSDGRLARSRFGRVIQTSVDLGPGTDSVVMGGTRRNDWMILADEGIRLGSPVDEHVNIEVSGVELFGAIGLDGDDEIRAWNVVASISGQAGNDLIFGGNLAASLEGGRGHDLVYGSSENDAIDPGPGNDVVKAGTGDDVIASGGVADGADVVRGGGGSDTVVYADRAADLRVTLDRRPNDGEQGEHDLVTATIERVLAGSGDDRLGAGWNADPAILFSGGDGNDRLVAGGGPAELLGGPGNDELWGGVGDDVIVGGDGDDSVGGGYGDDTFVAQATVDGTDRYWGDAGSDTVTYEQRSDHVKLAIGIGGSGAVGEHDRIDDSVEVVIAGSARDRLIGSEGDDVLVGGRGRDRLEGNEGADQLYGGEGNDDIDAGDGSDQVWAEGGADSLHLTDGGSDVADCGSGADDASDRDPFDVDLVACEVI